MFGVMSTTIAKHPQSIAEIGALIGDSGRARMLDALMDGRSLTARELAAHAGIAPQTASGHLARMLDAGLLAMQQHGRHRYHRAASTEVARLLETMVNFVGSANGGGGADQSPRCGDAAGADLL